MTKFKKFDTFSLTSLGSPSPASLFSSSSLTSTNVTKLFTSVIYGCL